MADPAPKELLKKLAGRKIQLSTRCGTFRGTTGTVKDVFDEFFLFVTIDEKFLDNPPIRNWIMMQNVGVVTEELSPQGADANMEVTRYELE